MKRILSRVFEKVLIFLIVGLIVSFVSIKLVNAEMLANPQNITYVSGRYYEIQYDRLFNGNRYATITIYDGGLLNYYVVDYSYRMSTPGRKYNVYFQLYADKGEQGTITLNNQPCQVYSNTYNDVNTVGGSTLNNTMFNVACVNIDPEPNQFQLVVRYDTNYSQYHLNVYGIKNGFFVSSYPSEEQALNNAMSDLASAITTNNTDNSNRIINSVNNMADRLNQKQTQTNEKLTELTDFFKDDTSPQSDYTFAPQFESGGILTNLINLPLSMASTLMNALSNQCVPFTVRLPFVDTDLVIPCISEFIASIEATVFFEGIGATAGGFILYNYLKYLALLFDKSLRFELTIKDVI